MAEPSAIMERRPAPGIVRHPIPSAIGIDPAATIVIGLPARIDHHDRRLPARAITVDVHPVPIRRQRAVEGRIIGDLGWRCGRLRRILRSDRVGLRSGFCSIRSDGHL